MQTYGLYIDGAWVETTERYEVRNPANGEPIALCAVGDEATLNAAVEAAARAFPDWAARSYEERGELLRAVAQGLKARYETLAIAESQETGRCLRETMAHDIPATIAVFEYFAGIAPATLGETIPVPGMYLNYTRREPYGVIGAITPWNFPLWLAAIKIAPALAAGNTMVLKPAPTTPLTALMLAEVMHEAGIPQGVFNVLTDPTPATLGDLLTRHPKVRKISFTGSTGVGVRVMQNAATHIAPVSLELGGKSPFLVFADADFDRALAHALLANYFAQGQMCTAATRIFVERPIYERFRDAFVARAQRLQIGDPLDPTTEFATLHKREQLEKTEFYVRTALEEGAQLLAGGKRLTEPPFDRGFYFPPTVLEEVQPTMRVACDEIFGPVALLMPFEGEEEAIRLANSTDYGLAAGVWTQDIGKALRVAHQIEAGKVWINCYNMIPPQAPYGGYKLSGFGRELGLHCLLDLYTQVKNVQVDLSPDYFEWFS